MPGLKLDRNQLPALAILTIIVNYNAIAIKSTRFNFFGRKIKGSKAIVGVKSIICIVISYDDM